MDRQRALSPAPGLGHNQGPPLAATSWNAYCWRKAHKAAWKTPPIEVVRQRCRRADQLGLSYQEYTAHILDRGTHLCALLFTLLGTLIQKTQAIGTELADGFRVLPGVAERLSRLKELKNFVMVDLTGRIRDTLDPRLAGSLVERLNRRCENVIVKHEICLDPHETADAPDQPLANFATQLLRRDGLSAAAAVMVGSSDKDKHCSETARLGKYVSAERFFGWPTGSQDQPRSPATILSPTQSPSGTLSSQHARISRHRRTGPGTHRQVGA
jgi:hypothetical protein